MVFWGYNPRAKNGESWVTLEQFNQYKNKAADLKKENEIFIKNKKNKLKRGDIREDGMVFWAYATNIIGGEQWITREKMKDYYDRAAKRRAARTELFKSHKKKYKRGDIRADGMVFWQYKPGREKSEYWIMAEAYEGKKVIQKKQAKTFAKKEKVFSCGDVSEDGMVFWSYNRGMPNCEWWMDKRQHDQFRKKSTEVCNERRKIRIKTDNLYKLIQSIRCLISCGFQRKGYTKNSKTHEILGCTFEYFAKHIEDQFTDGMSWANRSEWHLDHRLPVSAARSEDEVVKLNHYTNFQPMWAKDNISKSDKHDPEELKAYLAA